MKIKNLKNDNIGYLHIDITYGPQIDGKKMYIYVAIDIKTRIMYLEVHDNKKAETVSLMIFQSKLFSVQTLQMNG